MREQFANGRRTSIEENELEQDIEDLIQQEDMVVTVSVCGLYQAGAALCLSGANRGGKGRSGMSTRDEDFVSNIFMPTHQPLLFSTSGMVYKLKVYKLPQGTPQARGKPWSMSFPWMTAKRLPR